MQKTTILLLITSLLTFNAACVSTADKPSSHPKVGKENASNIIVARVNGVPIYSDRLNTDIKKELRAYKKYGMKNQSPDLMTKVTTKALNKAIRYELVRQESHKLEIADIDERTENKFLDIRNKYPDEEMFNRYLKMRNLTVDKMKANLRASVYIDEYLLQQKISDPDIPENILRSFYESNPKTFRIDEQIKASHILIKVADNATEEDIQNAYVKAAEIRKRILDGNDFAEAAIINSECNSAPGGGSLKYIKRGYMPKEFEEAAFALKIDEISDVVRTKFGFHIIKVSEKIPEGTQPYEDVRDFIKKFFQKDETKKRLEAHIAQLKEKAEIEILLPQD